MIDDLVDPSALAAEQLFPVKDHAGIPWPMFDREAIDRLWSLFRITTYSAARRGMTPLELCRVFDPMTPTRPAMAAARLDQLVIAWRKRRGF